eukprot:6576050-Heterocapsa_arctica.AAC.1
MVGWILWILAELFRLSFERRGTAGRKLSYVPCLTNFLVQHLVPDVLVPVDHLLVGFSLREGGVLLLLIRLVLRFA